MDPKQPGTSDLRRPSLVDFLQSCPEFEMPPRDGTTERDGFEDLRNPRTPNEIIEDDEGLPGAGP